MPPKTNENYIPGLLHNLTPRKAEKYCKELQSNLEKFKQYVVLTDAYSDKFPKDDRILYDEVESLTSQLLRIVKRLNNSLEKQDGSLY